MIARKREINELSKEDMICPECGQQGVLTCGSFLPRQYQGRHVYLYCSQHGVVGAFDPTVLSCIICGKCDTMRYYDIDGKKYPSVTSILAMLPDPPALAAWKAKPDSWKKSQRAVVQGSLLHFRVGNYYAAKMGLPPFPLELNPGYPKPDKEMGETVSAMFSYFQEFDAKYQPKVLAVEQVLYHEMLEYAGTGDCIAEIDGEVWILDWKTTERYVPDKKPYENYDAQLWAYKAALAQMGRFRIARMAVVYLSGGGYVFAESRGDEDRFKEALSLFREAKTGKEVTECRKSTIPEPPTARPVEDL